MSIKCTVTVIGRGLRVVEAICPAGLSPKLHWLLCVVAAGASRVLVKAEKFSPDEALIGRCCTCHRNS